MSFVIKGRRVCLPDGIRAASIVVEDGRIAKISEEPLDVEDTYAIADDEVLLPALTDTHVHVNEPGRTQWEGFRSATRAAAAGGVTMLVDMPLNSDPVTTSLDALHQKLDAAKGKLFVDVGFWGGVVPGNAKELAPMAKAGALGFKCFTCFSGIDEFPASTEADLRVAMPILRDAKVPLLVHAELESELVNVHQDASPRLYARYLHSRPKAWEDAAVAMIVGLVRETRCPAHIVHLSSAGSLDILRQAKAEGLPITAETCPHYLGLAAEDVPDGATEYKCAPPIRERENQDRLWGGLADGTLDFVVTDHSPCIPALKKLDTGDFAEAWGGIASLQLGLRSVWTEARRRGVPLETVVRWMAGGTAVFAGRPKRGQLVVGAPADLVVFEPDAEAVLDADELHHRHPTSPWVGKRLAGVVRETWKDGTRIALDGDVGGPPAGNIVLGRAS